MRDMRVVVVLNTNITERPYASFPTVDSTITSRAFCASHYSLRVYTNFTNQQYHPLLDYFDSQGRYPRNSRIPKGESIRPPFALAQSSVGDVIEEFARPSPGVRHP
jgi:hypothetical protein